MFDLRPAGFIERAIKVGPERRRRIAKMEDDAL